MGAQVLAQNELGPRDDIAVCSDRLPKLVCRVRIMNVSALNLSAYHCSCSVWFSLESYLRSAAFCLMSNYIEGT